MVRVAKVLAAVVALLLCAAISAQAERNGEGDLLVTFNSDLRPATLPRQTAAPVSVRVAGDFGLASGDSTQLPQLQTISIAINRQGQLFDRGLPTCNLEEIQPATEAVARRICGNAIVGSGHVSLQARLPPQPTFMLKARLLAFNGPREGGDRLILAQAYASKPPGAFVLTFRVSRHQGLFGTVLSTTLPRAARNWAYLTHFDMTLHRTYDYRGKRRSYVSAACRTPAGFDVAVFPFARATYVFANGQSLATTTAETCHVSG